MEKVLQQFAIKKATAKNDTYTAKTKQEKKKEEHDRAIKKAQQNANLAASLPVTAEPESKEHEAFMSKKVTKANLTGKIERIEMIDPVELIEINKYRSFMDSLQKEKKMHLERMQQDLKRAIVMQDNPRLKLWSQAQQQMKWKDSDTDDVNLLKLFVLEEKLDNPYNNKGNLHQAAYKKTMDEIKEKVKKMRKGDPFDGMKYDKDFIEKIYDIEQHTKEGKMFDDKRIDKNIYKFFEKRTDNKESAMMRNLRQKFNKHMTDITPFLDLSKQDNVAKNILESDYAFEKKY